MSAISWSDGLTLGTSNASAGDDELRSIMTSIASGLQPSFYWPGTGGGSLASAGESQPGNARAARAGNSAVTGGYGDGYLLLNTNHISLHHIGSTWTAMLAHASMLDHDGSVSAPSLATARWVTQAGSFSLSSTSDGQVGQKTVSFTSSYDTFPLVFVTVQQPTLSSGYLVNVSSLVTQSTATMFTSTYSGVATVVSVATVHWESSGTMALTA